MSFEAIRALSVLTHLYSAKFLVYSPIYYVEFLSRSHRYAVRNSPCR